MKIRHNADTHVTFYGIENDGLNIYVTRNGRTLTGTAYGRESDARSNIRWRAQLPGTRQRPALYWWEVRHPRTGALLYPRPQH